ncbi:MAG: hypothetical protein V3V99_03070 [candidate division Zixibacteria bacterium]
MKWLSRKEKLVLHGRSMYDEAIRLLRLNINEHPESDFNWANFDGIGQAHLELRDTTRSIENFRTSLQLNPDNTNAAKILEQLDDN